MAYTYNDDLCYRSNEELKKHYEAAQESLKQIIHNTFNQTNDETKYYKLFHPVDTFNQINPLIEHAEVIRNNFDDILIIGMGGASLNPASLLALRTSNSKPRFHFLNSTEPRKIATLLADLDLSKTACLVISNSGSTTETISIFGVLLNKYQEMDAKNIHKHFYFIVGASDNPIRNVAIQLGSSILDHDQGISGRYSGFTNVSLLPGLIAGLDIQEFLKGANTVINDFWQNKENSKPAQGAATLFALNAKILVNTSYSEGLATYLEWQRQCISESLGKDGKGFTPLHGIGPMEQHSILQLYLDGPKDKVFTFFALQDSQEYADLKISTDVMPSYLQGKEIAQINNAEYQATLDSLVDKKLPVRSIILDAFNEFSLGALMMHTAMEIIILGHLMEVNPFDQPGVEQIKVKAKQILESN